MIYPTATCHSYHVLALITTDHIPLNASLYICSIFLQPYSSHIVLHECICALTHKIGASTILSPLRIPCPTRGRGIPSQKFHSQLYNPFSWLFLASFLTWSSFPKQKLSGGIDLKISHSTSSISPSQLIWAKFFRTRNKICWALRAHPLLALL